MARVTFALLLLLLIGVSMRTEEERLSEMYVATDEGWFDINLTILSTAVEKNGAISVIAKGLSNGKVVGLKVTFAPNMKQGISNDVVDKKAFLKNGVIYKSIGRESDELLQALADLYKVPCQGCMFASQASATSFALEDKPVNLRTGVVNLKVFFNDSAGEDKYAEWFTNVNIPEQRLELHEKDEGYRANIIKALSAP